MAGKEWYDAEKNIFITKGSSVANVIASSGLMGGSVRRAYEPGASSAATTAQLQQQLVSRLRSPSAKQRASTHRLPSPRTAGRPQSASGAYSSARKDTPEGEEGRPAMGAPSPAASRPVSASRKDSAILLEASRRAERQKASSRHGDSRGPGAVRAWQSAAEDGTRCDDFDSRMGDKGHEMNREVLPPPDEESQCGSDGGTATREKELHARLGLAEQQAAKMQEAADQARSDLHQTLSDLRENEEAVEARKAAEESALAAQRRAEGHAAAMESAKRNAERRARGLEAEVTQLRGQLDESRLHIDKLIAEAAESQKHWERERSKHIDTAKKLRAEKKEEAKQAQAEAAQKLEGMQRAVDFLRRELTARDTTVEQLRLDLEERIAAAAGARKPKEPDAGARETPFEPAENARDPGGAEHRRVEQQGDGPAPLEAEASPRVEPVMAEAHVKEAEERLARERQRSSELAAALRKANRQTAEARKTHAAALMELDERMSCLDAEREESVASLSASMALLVERTAALLAGRKPGNRKQGGAKGQAAGKSAALCVMEEMNEQLAAENASLLAEVSKLQSLAPPRQQRTGYAAASALRVATEETVVMHKREVLEDGEPTADSGDESKADAACQAAQENLALRAEVSCLQTKVATLQASLQATSAGADDEIVRANQLLSEREQQLEALRRDNAEVSGELDKLRATWHTPEEFQAEVAKLDAARVALKAAKEEAQRKANAFSAAKSEKQKRDEQLEKEIAAGARLQHEVIALKEELRRQQAQVSKLRAQVAGEERTPDSESGESEASVLGSARPGGGQDYPRLKLQLSEKEAQLAKTRAEAQASASEAERLQGALAKAKRQLAVREKEKDAAVKALEEELRFAKDSLVKQADANRTAAEAAKAAASAEAKELAEVREELLRTRKEAERARIEHEYLKQRSQLERPSAARKKGMGLCHAFSIGISPIDS